MTSHLLGKYGTIILAVCVAGACLTTAIGLVATVGEYFSNITKVKYETIVILTVFSSFLLSILGVESIIKIAVPILVLIYPVIISLIILNIFHKYIVNDNIYKGVVLFTGIVGLIEALQVLNLKNDTITSIYEILPFSDFGLTWLLPGILGFIIFSFLKKKKK